MPLNPRVRDNNVFGTVDDNPLTAGASSFNSVGLINMSVIATKHAMVTLDPLRQYGDPELIIVTVHTIGSTVATITRGAYGTIARNHPNGTLWVHAPLDEDFIEIVTSITRPSDPYEGQFIFETDTNKLVGYGGVDWAPRDAGGQLGYTEKIATNQTGMTAIVDLTGLSVVVTVGTGRRIRILSWVPLRQITSTGLAEIQIREGATTLSRHYANAAAAEFMHRHPIYVTTPTAGVHTYKLSALTSAGTLDTNYEAVNPAFILVEDIGAA